MRAILALEDGSVFIGSHFGTTGTEVGEACFNTSMTGYQEVLTDPSYSGQIVTMTYPLIGNYGITPEDNESAGARVSGFEEAELAEHHSNWRATEALGPWLERQGVIGIEGVDTRKIAKHLRSAGAMRACLTTELAPEEAVEAARKAPSMEGCNIVDKIGSHPMTPEEVDALVTDTELPPVEHDIVAFDFGIKYNILRQLRENGFRVTVVPAHTTAEEVLAMVRKCPKNCWMVGTASPVMHKYVKYPLKWALRNKLRSMRGKPACLDKKWCDVGQDPMQGDLREKF